MANRICGILEQRIPDINWESHSAPTIIAGRLLATAHGLGGAVVAYSVHHRPNGTPRLDWHWATHEAAAEWCRSVKADHGDFGKYSMFFQTGPWMSPPASLPPPPAAAAADPAATIGQLVARRPTEAARLAAITFPDVPPVVLRMLAEGMLDVWEHATQELVRLLF
ncbi:hypothetical protein BC832DRAFT_591505 [Gaertneriomyces semiglobifer]|nr:hypothetical protein BC832DRAFT_591505 [Gaertneriomyces semiglobifer]